MTRATAILIGAWCVFSWAAVSAAEESDVRSPDGLLRATVGVTDGQPTVAVTWRGKPLLDASPLGLAVAGAKDGGGWRELRRSVRSIDETWTPVWGKRRRARNRCGELTVSVARSGGPLERLDIVVRAYDDGVAFRYVLEPGSAAPKPLEVTDDLAEFRFAGDWEAWSYRRERRPLGPERLSEAKGGRHTPMTLRAGPDRYVAIVEAALEDFAPMELASDAGSRAVRVEVARSRVTPPFATPWRVLLIGQAPGVLVDSDLLVNLNPPCRIDDPSWIKPGVAFWDWRAWGHQANGFTYGLDLASWKRFVDLAGEAGVPYLLLDADWYGPEFDASSDPTTAKKGANVEELIRYARARGVGILLYLNDKATRQHDLDAVLKHYADWGAAGIKYGFMRGTGQAKVQRTREIIACCARHRLVCDFHDGPVPPTGDRRTWPNCLTREFCHSQSDAKRVFTPGTFCLQVYVNLVAGPIDMCNGLLDLTHALEQRPKIFEQVDATVVAEIARTLIVFSGLTVVPDSADSYRRHPDLFEFIAAQKMPWDESRTLAGDIGEYIVTMRRTGEVVLVASATNEAARTLTIPLDFLGPGTYRATLCEDAPDAHYQRNREAYGVRRCTVTAADTIEARLAPGGGHCMMLVPVGKKGN